MLIVSATVLIYLTQWQLHAADITLHINNNRNNNQLIKREIPHLRRAQNDLSTATACGCSFSYCDPYSPCKVSAYE